MVPFSNARAESLFRAESLLLGPAPHVSMAGGTPSQPGALGVPPAAEGRRVGSALSMGGSVALPSGALLLPSYSSSFGPGALSGLSRAGTADLPKQRGGTDAVQVWEVWEVLRVWELFERSGRTCHVFTQMWILITCSS